MRRQLLFASIVVWAAARITHGAEEVFSRTFHLPIERVTEGRAGIEPQAGVAALFKRAGLEIKADDGPQLHYNARTETLYASGSVAQLEKIEWIVAAFGQGGEELAVTVDTVVAECSDEMLAKLQEVLGPGPKRAGPFQSEVIEEMKQEASGMPVFQCRPVTAGAAREALRMLEQAEGVDLLTAPKITTLSGRQARILLDEAEEAVLIPPFHAPSKRAQEAARFTAE